MTNQPLDFGDDLFCRDQHPLDDYLLIKRSTFDEVLRVLDESGMGQLSNALELEVLPQ